MTQIRKIEEVSNIWNKIVISIIKIIKNIKIYFNFKNRITKFKLHFLAI